MAPLKRIPSAKRPPRSQDTTPSGSSSPRIVTLDIETAPSESYHWGIWEENISLDQIKTDWTILSFAAKWLDKRDVLFHSTGGRGAERVRDDNKVLKALWDVLHAADIVVGQNVKAFDLKKINSRMLAHGFPPYSPVRVVDTKLVAKRHFAFTSNRLEWLSQLNAETRKSKHKKFPGFELWAECLKDNPAAWAEMRKYNVADVLATEELYLKLRPWIDGHPNVVTFRDAPDCACPKCGSRKLQRRGSARTQVGSYQRYQCIACGGWARGRQTNNSDAARKGLLAQ